MYNFLKFDTDMSTEYHKQTVFCSRTVPVVSCCGTLSQPIQTSVQGVLDPVLRAGGVLHLDLHLGSTGGTAQT